MLGKMGSDESSSVNNPTVQGGPQNKQFSRPHPVLAILLGKNMDSSQALEVTEDGVTN